MAQQATQSKEELYQTIMKAAKKDELASTHKEVLAAIKKVSAKKFAEIYVDTCNAALGEKDVGFLTPLDLFEIAEEEEDLSEELVQLKQDFSSAQDLMYLKFLRNHMHVFEPKIIAKAMAICAGQSEIIGEVLDNCNRN
jgi:cytochrome c1